MELDLSADQELFRATVAKFIQTACPLSAIRRQLASDEIDVPIGYLEQAAEVGFFAPLVPESFGGGSISGQPVRELAIVSELRGGALQPGPFVSMNVVASAVGRCGSPTQQEAVLPAIASGAATAAWAIVGARGGCDPGETVSVCSRGAGFALSGEAQLVQGAANADWLLVSARSQDGLSQFLIDPSTPGVSIIPVNSHDLTQRFATVIFKNVEVSQSAGVGEPGRASEEINHQLRLALVLSVAETVGAMDSLFELTRQYALDRIAFGRPIGSFQAVKHQLADLSLLLETSKAGSSAGTRAVQDDREDADEIASITKAWIGDAGIDLAQGCFQIFAGIGYTWEHDLHLYLRRITMNAFLWGQPSWHRERICALHDLN
jgi:alkylation response protein AidB-like acyl-CoA dehydrogenase